MATIKMDVTEYQEMQKVAELLKEAIKKEEEYRKTIEAMQAEKIAILENNKKRVIIRNEVQTIETRSLIVNYDEFKRNILFLADDIKHHSNHSWGVMHANNVAYARDVFDRMFKIHTSEGVPEVSTTYEGLDEVEKKMKDDYYTNQNQSIKDKLAGADDMKKLYDDMAAENTRFIKTVNIYKDKLEKLGHKNKYLKSRLETFVKEMKGAAYTNINIFNYAQFKVKLIKILKCYV